MTGGADSGVGLTLVGGFGTIFLNFRETVWAYSDVKGKPSGTGSSLLQAIGTIPWEEFSKDILGDDPVAGEAEVMMVRLGTANFGVRRA